METIQTIVQLEKMPIQVLDEKHSHLVKLAVRYLDLAYAPYSNFHVGAAILLANGEMVGGANQENASYPLCMCGERVALYHSAMAFPNILIESLAITARNQFHPITEPVMPCGACRQVILEYEQRQKTPIKILLRTDEDIIFISESAKNLIPYGFDGSFLK